ncbi:MAG TPA: hypothetical protein VMT67_06565 [Terriglobales bacterium]|nr:hypothetical protein [Terriglobales bacterium]
MPSGRIGAELAVVAIFCILTIFLFPLMQGPYSVVNGPVTALQAARTAARVRYAIQSALKFLQSSLYLSLVVLCSLGDSGTGCEPLKLVSCGSILRC